jgi:hypothetical protein
MRANRETQRALQGLDRPLRKQLAGLVLETYVELEKHFDEKEKKRRFPSLHRERVLLQKVARARQLLEELRNDAKHLCTQTSNIPHVQRAADSIRRLAEHYLEETSNILDRFGPARSFEPLPRIAQNPTTFAMVKLYWFFRHGCRLSGHEAEVRTALIRNAFWKKFGIPPVEFFREYRPDQSMGCPAVHQAVLRFRP